MKISEHELQTKFFTKLRYYEQRYPQLAFIFAVPNGGARDVRVAVKMKAEGVKKGVPDIFVPIPSGGMHGLFIEMKAGKNKMTPEQIQYKTHLEANGYAFALCYSDDEAWEVLTYYLKLS